MRKKKTNRILLLCTAWKDREDLTRRGGGK